EPWQQKQRRTLLATGVMVITLVGLLVWFLMHPSTSWSPARRVKNVVFGQRLTEVAEQFAGTGGGRGERGAGDGKSGGQSGSKGQQGGQSGGSGQQGNGGQSGDASGTDGAGTTGASGGDGGALQPGHGHGTPLTGPVSGPANPHDPTDNPAELAAPDARSIGW